MKTVPRSLLGLLLLLGAAPAAWSRTALAPTPPLIGDGQTRAQLMVATDVAGARLKVRPERGRVGTITPVAGGFLVEFLPPRVSERSELAIELMARGPGGREEVTASVQLVPTWDSGFAIELDPEVVSPGRSASVRVRPRRATPQADARRDPRIAVSTGSVTGLVPSGDGSWVARYTPPVDLREPAHAAFVVVDGAAPFEVPSTASLPITVRRSITLDAPVDSTNVLIVGHEEYGPRQASPAGKVAFGLDLHPAYSTGLLRTVGADGQRSDQRVDLPVAALPAIAIAPTPERGPASTAIPVLVHAVNPDGSAIPTKGIAGASLRGSVSAAEPYGPGLARLSWTLPADGSDTLTLSHGEVSQTATVDVVGAPVTVSLSADPAPLPDGVRDFSVTARLKDGRGTGVVGRIPTLTVDGASRLARARDNGDGTYTARYRLRSGVDSATVFASVALQPTGLPVHRLLLWPAIDHLPADGTSTVPVLVVAEDALGMPVPDLELTLSVPTGDGSLPPTVRTGADGTARASYRAGTEPGFAALVAEGAGLDTTAPVWQLTADAPAPQLAGGGSELHRDALARWQGSLSTLLVGRAGAPAADTTPAVATTPVAGPPVVTSPTAPQSAQVRLRVGVINGPFSYDSELEGDADDYAPQATFAVSPWLGAIGLDPQVEAWLGAAGTWGVEAQAHILGYRVQVGDEAFTNVPLDLHGGVRYQFFDSAPWAAWAGLSAQYTVGTLFAYSNDAKTAAELVNYPLVGARLAAGLRAEPGSTRVQLEVAETFVPFPVLTRADLIVDIALDSPVDLYLGGALEYRSLRYEVAEESSMRVKQFGQEVRIGVSVPLD